MFLRQGRRRNPWSGLKSVVDSQTVWHVSGTARRHSAKHDCDTLELACNVRPLLPQVISLQIACTLQTVENDVWWRHHGRMTHFNPTFAHSLTMIVWHTSSWKVRAFNDVTVLDRCRRGSPHGGQLQRQSVQSYPSLLGLAGGQFWSLPNALWLQCLLSFFCGCCHWWTAGSIAPHAGSVAWSSTSMLSTKSVGRRDGVSFSLADNTPGKWLPLAARVALRKLPIPPMSSALTTRDWSDSRRRIPERPELAVGT